MQAMVRSMIPYIQRFLYHHDELSEVYSELAENNIGEKIKRLYFGQVSLKTGGNGLFGGHASEALFREKVFPATGTLSLLPFSSLSLWFL